MIQDIRDGGDHHGEILQVWTMSGGQWFDLFYEPRSFVECEKINFKCQHENKRKRVFPQTIQFSTKHVSSILNTNMTMKENISIQRQISS